MLGLFFYLAGMPRKPNCIWILAVLCFLSFFLQCRSESKDAKQKERNTPRSIDEKIARKEGATDMEYSKQLLEALKEIDDFNNDTLKSTYVSRVSLAFLGLKDSVNFRETNQSSRELGQKIKDTTRIAESHWDLATYFKKRSLVDSAFYHYAKAQKLYGGMANDFLSGRMLYNMAIIQEDVKDYTGSEINTVRAIELLKPLNKYKQLYYCYNNLGIISRGLKEYENALKYYQKASEYAEKGKMPKSIQYSVQNNLGVVYQEQKNYTKAASTFENILTNTKRGTMSPARYARALDNLAYNQFKSGSYPGVEEKLKEALFIRDSINDIGGLSGSHYSLAEFYLSQKDTIAARAEGEKAKLYAEKSSSNERLLQVLELLARLNPNDAIAYTASYIKLNDSLQQEERKARNKFARIRFETNETLEQNRLLARQKQLWTGISIAVGLLAIAAFLFFDQRAKNQKLRFQQEQQASNEKIFHLMLDQKQKVEEGKKIAQKRISEELHDGVQGRLQGARMVLLGLNKRTTPEAIAERSEAIKELQDIQEEVRAISHELSHAAYQKIHNFINTINELLEGIKASAKLAYTFEYDENVPWDELKSDIKINLYRMVQESLQNCVKHAKADHVTVRFDVAQELLKVSIADNGAGFEIKKGKKGIGLRNIASRIEKIGGHWDIESTVGKGTTVYFSIPVALSDGEQTENTEKELQES